jgi:eukaryotic-like serine/threonine-protein kinase
VETGQSISHYRIVEKLGEGGMGVVYKAQDSRLGRFVALKLLPPERVSDSERRRRFAQEARAASALDHPAIVRIYDIDEDGGVPFIAMEYIGGRTLADIIPRNGLPLETALKYAIQIADALARAHQAGIVHRDIKPANIMVTDEGRIKVLDFGLAKLRDDGAGAVPDTGAATRTLPPATGEGMLLGTDAYMSPEQAEGKPVDARSDIFSFGSMLYEMLSGRRAFTGDSQLATLSAIVASEPPPLNKAPGDLEKLIARCLRKDPQRRIQHMGDVRLALEDLAEVPAGGAGPPLPTPARKPTWRRHLFGLAAAVLIVALGGAAWWLGWGRRSGAEREAAPSPPVPLTSYPGFEVQPSFSPDGNQVAFSWAGERQDNPDIYVKLIGGAEKPLRLTSDPALDYSPAWSPDGRFIAFVRESRDAMRTTSVAIVPAIGGPEKIVTELALPYLAPGGDQSAALLRIVPFPVLAWVPGGKFLIISERVSPSNAPSLFVVPAEGGEKRRLTTAPKGSYGDGAPAVSPDGRTLIFIRASSFSAAAICRMALAVGATAAGPVVQLGPPTAWRTNPAWLEDGREIVFAQSDIFFGAFTLWRMEAAVGAVARRLELAGEDASWPAVSPRGSRLAFSVGTSDENIWRVAVGENGSRLSNPEKLIASTRDDKVAQYSPDGKRIVFTSNRSGVHEVWVADADGANPVQLTSFGRGLAGSPRWSPDGTHIVFDDNVTGRFEIYTIRPTGGAPRQITDFAGDNALGCFSGDGRWIYFRSVRGGGPVRIWKIPAAGGEPVLVTPSGPANGALLSPEGAVLYFRRGSQLWSMPSAGGAETRVLDSASFLGYAATSRGIYFTPMCGGAPCPSIHYYDLATRRTTQVLTAAGRLDVGLSVSPDGRYLLYTQVDQSGADLMLMENVR